MKVRMVALLAAAALTTPIGAAQSEGEERLLEALRLLRDPAAPPVAEVAAGLTRVAGGGLGLLVDVLLSGSVPCEAGGPARKLLGEAQRELALKLLEQLPSRQVLAVLEREAAGREGPAVELGALEILGAVGDVGQMPGFFERASNAAAALPSGRVEPVLVRALARMLARSESCRGWLGARWRSIEPALLPATARAVGAAGHADGLVLLAQWIETRAEFSLDAMAQVPLLLPAPSELLDQRLRELLRARLDPGEPAACRAALRALGELEDAHAVPLWIELLAADERGLASDALWALRRLSGLELTDQAGDWTRWHAAERRWFDEEYERAVAELAGEDPAAASAALRELAGKRLERALVAQAVTGALAHSATGVRVLACRTLALLGRPESAAALEEALSDPEPAVRTAARVALAQRGMR